jgi:predicted GH43/DUF377 family glycosyl hydrolase
LHVGVISIGTEDFLAKRFDRWEGPVTLSHSGRDKNWVLFPEKIQGHFAVLHSIIGDDADHVRIEYTDDLAALSQRTFVSPDPQQVPDTRIAWHTHVRSAGPPPLKTDKGWLVFYHAYTERDAKASIGYRVGAMLLDLTDPTRVLCRATAPVISPDERYENEGKPGVVFACGATIQNGILHVYYGGADKVVCVATAPLTPFLDALSKGSQTSLTSVSAQTV